MIRLIISLSKEEEQYIDKIRSDKIKKNKKHYTMSDIATEQIREKIKMADIDWMGRYIKCNNELAKSKTKLTKYKQKVKDACMPNDFLNGYHCISDKRWEELMRDEK